MEIIHQTPIFIAGPPRSGTTMLAGLFAKHNVWVGRAKTTDYPGTNSDFGSENIDIKNIMKREAMRQHYHNWRVPLPEGKLDASIKDEIEAFVPESTRWLVKTSWTLTFHEFWNTAYPEAYWVLPCRGEEVVVNSMNRHPSMRKRPDNMKRKFVHALQTRQKYVNSNFNRTLMVNMYKVSRRDKETIENLFEFVEELLDWDVVNQWIEPKMFSRK